MTTANQPSPDQPAPRKRGRRPSGEDTKAALLSAARAVFAEAGYHHATVRAIAGRAGVDPAMVNHWFGNKEGLFAQAVLRVPFDLREVLDDVTADGREHLGENIVRRFVSVWDGAGGEVFVALVRSITTHQEALEGLKEVLVKNMLSTVADVAGGDRPELRTSLCATQIIGLGVGRYVAGIEPLASADIDTLVATVAPTLQRYLTGDLGVPA